MVMLPSASGGGFSRFSYGGVTVEYPDSRSNLFHITALSWFTDAAFSWASTSDGCRWGLSYKLVLSDETLSQPRPSCNESVVERIRRALGFWAQDGGATTPEKILYLLENSYPASNLSFDELKGADAHKGRLLYALAQELGFNLGLANVNCHLCGYADKKYKELERQHKEDWEERREEKEARREEYYEECDRWSRRSSPTEVSATSDETDEEQDVEFGEVDIREAEIDRFVDIRGQWISDTFDFEDDETIPEDLCEDAEGEDHYKQEYDGFRDVRNCALCILRTWTHSFTGWGRRTRPL